MKTTQDLEHELRDKISESCAAGLTDKAMARVRGQLKAAMSDAQADFEHWLREDGARNLSEFVQRMAEDAITAILKGDDAEMRRRLQCVEGGWTARYRDHPVIHGRLFEHHAIELRKQIVDAHADLLKGRRILDLEDQVRYLVEQVNKANVYKEQMMERLRDL
jgi:hypothetical protein